MVGDGHLMRPPVRTQGLSVWTYGLTTESAYRIGYSIIGLSHDATIIPGIPDVALTGHSLHSLKESFLIKD